jgi:hypothetical protein
MEPPDWVFHRFLPETTVAGILRAILPGHTSMVPLGWRGLEVHWIVRPRIHRRRNIRAYERTWRFIVRVRVRWIPPILRTDPHGLIHFTYSRLRR